MNSVLTFLSNSFLESQEWWCTSIIPVLERLRQKDQNSTYRFFEAH
jgi:hypothetical protein